MRNVSWSGRWAVALLALGLGSAAAAGLPRLPAAFTFPQGDGSPGRVTFNHDTHVDAARPACVGCHPARWSMLKKGQAVGLQAIRHEAMEKGQACGACHGKQAFGLDACDACHRS
jgi:c(7)-type cytochrome triheme protein